MVLTEFSASELNTNIRGYEVGEIKAQAAFTAEIQIVQNAGVSVQGLIDHQYVDSKEMSRRPGIYLKYLPYYFDEITGQMMTGGMYLFDTYANAEAYGQWAANEFEVGQPKTKFWDQPLFEKSVKIKFRVIGAVNFLPVAEHAMGRLERWTYDAHADADAALRKIYPVLRNAAKEQGAASFWLLHSPEEKTIAVQLAFARGKGDDHAAARDQLEFIRELPSLGKHILNELEINRTFNRTRLFLTLWLPLSRAAGGAELTIPNYPVVSAITHEHG